MLVFNRKEGERVVIGGDVVVEVVAIHREYVVLGFVAPREIAIHRQEVFDVIKRSREQFGGDEKKGAEE